jgi:hypothetical protein
MFSTLGNVWRENDRERKIMTRQREDLSGDRGELLKGIIL